MKRAGKERLIDRKLQVIFEVIISVSANFKMVGTGEILFDQAEQSSDI